MISIAARTVVDIPVWSWRLFQRWVFISRLAKAPECVLRYYYDRTQQSKKIERYLLISSYRGRFGHSVTNAIPNIAVRRVYAVRGRERQGLNTGWLREYRADRCRTGLEGTGLS